MDEVQEQELREIQSLTANLPHIRHVYNPRLHSLFERIKEKQEFKDLDAQETRNLVLLRQQIAKGKYSEFTGQNQYAVLARRKRAVRQGVTARDLPTTAN